MVGDGELYPSERKILPTPAAHRMNFGSLGPGVEGQLIRRHNHRAGSLGDRYRIAVMIPMAVGNQNHVRGHFLGGRRGHGIPRQKRVHQNFGLGGGEQKTGVPQILHRDSPTHFFFLPFWFFPAASAAITLVFLSVSSRALHSFRTEEGIFFTLPARMSLDSSFFP